MSQDEKENKLELIATKGFSEYDKMYMVVDFLNKYLKEKGIILGLVKDKQSNRLNINIYEFC